MGPPTTITRMGIPIVTIQSKEHGRGLPHHVKCQCALAFARSSDKCRDAVALIIAHGLADDVAGADELIREAEDGGR